MPSRARNLHNDYLSFFSPSFFWKIRHLSPTPNRTVLFLLVVFIFTGAASANVIDFAFEKLAVSAPASGTPVTDQFKTRGLVFEGFTLYKNTGDPNDPNNVDLFAGEGKIGVLVGTTRSAKIIVNNATLLQHAPRLVQDETQLTLGAIEFTGNLTTSSFEILVRDGYGNKQQANMNGRPDGRHDVVITMKICNMTSVDEITITGPELAFFLYGIRFIYMASSKKSAWCSPSVPEKSKLVNVSRLDTNQPDRCNAEGQFGNPIFPLRGSKKQAVDLGFGLGLTYDTASQLQPGGLGNRPSSVTFSAFGPLWQANLFRKIIPDSTNENHMVSVQAARGSGQWITFTKNQSKWVAPAGISDGLIKIPTGWLYLNHGENKYEVYDNEGALVSINSASGGVLTFTNNRLTPSGYYPTKIQNQTGRSWGFTYEQLQPNGRAPRVTMISNPDKGVLKVHYNPTEYINRITWPDNSSRSFLYEDPNFIWALTGSSDEIGVRVGTYSYDSDGRAYATRGAGLVESYVANWVSPPGPVTTTTVDDNGSLLISGGFSPAQGLTVTGPNGQIIALQATTVLGAPRLTEQSQPAGSGCGASSQAFSYDANGNISSKVDFNGTRSCYGNRPDRNLQITRIEGLVGTAACATVLPDGAALQVGSRKISTDWHPDWRLVKRTAGPGVITSNFYNGQPDISGAGALASCAPPTAVLPDGKPIAVLCHQVEQATSDTDGSMGFAAPLAGVAPREQRWTYNQDGQVLTHDGPRTDVADVTRYAYFSDTTADHTRGDLQTLTNAAGHVTNYLRYNPAGQLLAMVDPNGVVTTNTYDLRQRVTSTTVGGLTTTYTYDLAGQLLRMTNPDGTYAGYAYDPAHRLVAVFDNLGNRIDYMLDAAGNRTAERVNDDSGMLRRQLSRSFDALGRPQQTIGRE